MNKITKKILSIMLVSVLLAAVTGCGGSKPSTTYFSEISTETVMVDTGYDFEMEMVMLNSKTLTLFSDDSYELRTSYTAISGEFGNTDNFNVFYGTYTQADGNEDNTQVVTLSRPVRVEHTSYAIGMAAEYGSPIMYVDTKDDSTYPEIEEEEAWTETTLIDFYSANLESSITINTKYLVITE